MALEFELVCRNVSEKGQLGQLIVGPIPYDHVGHAESADGEPIVENQGYPGVGGDPEVEHSPIVPKHGVLAGIINDEGEAGCDRVLADRVLERAGARRGQVLGKAGMSREDLAVPLHDGEHGDGSLDQLCGQANQAVQDAGPRAVDRKCRLGRRDPGWLSYYVE